MQVHVHATGFSCMIRARYLYAANKNSERQWAPQLKQRCLVAARVAKLGSAKGLQSSGLVPNCPEHSGPGAGAGVS